jgi:hypothetical protein
MSSFATEPQRLSLAFDQTSTGEAVTVRVKPNAISVTYDTYTVYTFELTGRPYGAFVGGRNYRRGLDNRVLEKGRSEDGVPRSRELTDKEADDFLEGVRRQVEQTVTALREGTVAGLTVDPAVAVGQAIEWLGRITAWDTAALARDRERFLSIYRPISILPPDQYMALVVQATIGCPWNKCTFCDFYRDRAFRVRSREDLAAHVQEVKALLGEGIRLRQSIFLGDANALTVPWRRLRETFEVVNEAFPDTWESELPGRQIYGFTDSFGAGNRTAEEIAELAQMGLRRVYIGLESGHDSLLELVEKEGNAAEAVEAVRNLKAGGVNAGTIVLLGLGGRRYAEGHLRDTVATLNAMGLAAGDLVYFSEMVASEGLPYTDQMMALGLAPMTRDEMQDQMAEMKAGLRFDEGKGRPKMAVYDIRRFVY